MTTQTQALTIDETILLSFELEAVEWTVQSAIDAVVEAESAE